MNATNPSIGALIGKDGFLFLSNDSNHVLKQIQGELNLTGRQTSFWKNLILHRILHSDYLGVKYRFIIPPNKEVIYKNYLPDEIKFSNKRPINQILDSSDPLILSHIHYNPNENIDEHIAYPKGETHWCDAFAYKYVCEALVDTDFIPLKSNQYEIIFKSLPWYDLGSKINTNYSEKIPVIELKNRSAKCVFSNYVNNMGRIDIYENINRNLPVAVVFRDSFFTNLLDIFSESFSKVVFVWHPWIDWDVVEKYKPNILINMTVERFLVNLPNDLNGSSWEELADTKKL